MCCSANAVSSRDGLDTETGTESLLSHRRERERERARRRARETEQICLGENPEPFMCSSSAFVRAELAMETPAWLECFTRSRRKHGRPRLFRLLTPFRQVRCYPETTPPQRQFPRINGHSKSERTARDSAMGYDSASVMSSELDSSSFVDSEEDEDASRLSSSTEQSSSSQLMRRHKRRRRRHKMAKIDRSSSFSSITDSTMSLNIITVTLNMEKYNFLGISIVGQSNDRGDGGIYIGSIMKGGAVAADGRIEPGDMLLQVNDVNFENMSNDDAVRILREIVSKTGPISLTVAKCWDPSPRSYFTIPRAEPVRPIDPAAWISHTTALTGPYPHYEFDDLPLSVGKTDMATIVKVMQLPDSGLEIRDRMWLKITIANAVIGADVVDWLYSRVEGFKDRRDARKYASSLLKHGYLRHTVNKITFSEQCYYTFGDLCQNMASLNLNEGSSGGGSEQDTLAPLPPTTNPWPLGGQPFPYPPFPSAPPCFPPGYSDPSSLSHSHSHRSHSLSQSNHPSFGYSHTPFTQVGPGSCAQSERSHASSYGPPGLPPPYCLARLAPKPSVSSSTPPGAPPGRELASVPPELTASRQSFQHAMGNPCEFFVDIIRLSALKAALRTAALRSECRYHPGPSVAPQLPDVHRKEYGLR
ncbi:hypothetical protein CCH79_00006571 [Gambusia affinis]|uniref:Uncharacterized protein n=1 Tax=Gambusia affinis TaxID=33528 RepID=A0A315W8U9_GAMAF|nr:hypothetical protein CCH79_00006571 [Gambusia affinis]